MVSLNIRRLVASAAVTLPLAIAAGGMGSLTAHADTLDPGSTVDVGGSSVDVSPVDGFGWSTLGITDPAGAWSNGSVNWNTGDVFVDPGSYTGGLYDPGAPNDVMPNYDNGGSGYLFDPGAPGDVMPNYSLSSPSSDSGSGGVLYDPGVSGDAMSS